MSKSAPGRRYCISGTVLVANDRRGRVRAPGAGRHYGLGPQPHYYAMYHLLVSLMPQRAHECLLQSICDM